MRLISCVGIVSLFMIFCSSPSKAAESKFVAIKSSFANVYEYLDPKSTVIKQAKKGDHYELVYEGTSWFQIKTRDKVGWLEKRAGTIVDSPNYISPLSIVMVILLLAGTIGGATYYILNKPKTAEA